MTTPPDSGPARDLETLHLYSQVEAKNHQRSLILVGKTMRMMLWSQVSAIAVGVAMLLGGVRMKRLMG